MPEDKKAKEAAASEQRLGKVRRAVRDVPEPAREAVTSDTVDRLRRDPDLARVAEIAEIYAAN